METAEELLFKATLEDELSAPLERIKDGVEDTGDAVADLDRKASSASRGGLSRLSASGGRLASTLGSRLVSGARWGESAVGRLGSAAYRAGAWGMGKLSAATSTAVHWVGSRLVSAAKYGGLAVATIGGLAASVGIKTAASMETSQIAFTTMLGSGQKAKAFLKDLNKFAADTPFDFPGLVSASSSLISAGIDAKKVLPIMRTLGDVTSGMGTGAEGIQRATVALQQMTAAQRISGEDLNQLRDAGIPVYDLLASAMHKSKAEIAGLIQQGKLGKDALDSMMHALESGDGLERFNGLMEKQSHTLTGVWSTLQDTVQMGLARALRPAVPLLKDAVIWASDLAHDAMPGLKHSIRDLAAWYRADGAPMLADWRDKLGETWDKVQPLADEALPALKSILDGTLTTVQTIAPLLADVFDGFNGLPGWAKTAIGVGVGAGVVGKKLGVWSGLKGLVGNKRDGGLLRAALGATPATPMWVRIAGKGGGIDAPVGGPGEKGTPKTSAGKTAGKLATVTAAAGTLAKRAGPLALVYGAATSSQAPGQEPWRNATDAETTDRMIGELTPQQRATYTLGAESIREFDEALANLRGNAARYHAIKNFLNVGNLHPFDESQTQGLNALNDLLPVTRARLGQTVRAFVQNREAGKDLDRVFRNTASATDSLNGKTSDLDRIMGLGRVAMGKTGNAAQNLTPRMADAGDKAGRLGTNLDSINGERRATVTVDGIDTAQSKISALLSSMGNLGTLTGHLLGIPVAPRVDGQRERGGRVLAGRTYLVGEKRAELFRPDRNGYIEPRVPAASPTPVATPSSGTVTQITVAPGAVQVNNPASEIDLERAIARGMEKWVRERDERGAA